MSTLEENVVAKMLARLPPNMQKDVWQKLITIEGEQKQELEVAIFQVLLGRTIDDSIGVQMDLIGRVVGQPRGTGQSDTGYRPYLRARVITNNSEGTIEDLIAVINAVIGTGGQTFTLNSQGVKSLDVKILDEELDVDLGTIMLDFLYGAKEGGVQIRLWHLASSIGTAFTLAADTSANGLHSIGATTLNVYATTGFPSTGSLRLPSEIVTYTGITSTTFTGVSALTVVLADNDQIREPLDTLTGLGDTGVPSAGGKLSSSETV